jgi:F-type H+-transporting ATPase subunit a
MADSLESSHLIGHVKDAEYFEVPRFIAADGKLKIAQFRHSHEPIAQIKVGFEPIDRLIEPLDFRLTKFMVLEVIGALVIAVIFIRLANRMKTGERPTGRLWNLFEAMLLFIRDDVARPAIGKHDADRFLPFLWTVFFFILICNLMGMLPWAGSPTGALATTGAMAFVTFSTVVGSGMRKLGVVGFWTGQVPHMDLPLPLAIFLKPMVFLIEALGLCIKHFVLAVRLLANMMAGHLVLAVLIAFIAASWHSAAVYGVAPASILGATALSLLELFVAFLQAYIFTFLSALFIGMAVHPH